MLIVMKTADTQWRILELVAFGFCHEWGWQKLWKTKGLQEVLVES